MLGDGQIQWPILAEINEAAVGYRILVGLEYH